MQPLPVQPQSHMPACRSATGFWRAITAIALAADPAASAPVGPRQPHAHAAPSTSNSRSREIIIVIVSLRVAWVPATLAPYTLELAPGSSQFLRAAQTARRVRGVVRLETARPGP